MFAPIELLFCRPYQWPFTEGQKCRTSPSLLYYPPPPSHIVHITRFETHVHFLRNEIAGTFSKRAAYALKWSPSLLPPPPKGHGTIKSQILLPSAVDLGEKLTVSQLLNQSSKLSITQSVGQAEK